MTESRRSLTELAVLGLLAGGPSHGFALARELSPEGSLGRILTVRRPLVYRALDRLVESGLAVPISTEPGEAGPPRVVHRITPAGRAVLDRWLGEPVGHVRELRLAFQLKLAVLIGLGAPVAPLVRAQREALADTLDALDVPDAEPDDPLELWRRANASAVADYLDRLERWTAGPPIG